MNIGTTAHMNHQKIYFFTSWLIILFFLALYIIKSLSQMISTPLHDFDEANRAEGARQMELRGEWLFPVTGSPFLRNESQKILVRDNPAQYVYRHFERPPLAFWTMIITTKIFGEKEIFYRLPSLIFVLGTFVLVISCIGKRFGFTNPTTIISSAIILASSDLWLSGNYAMLDTTLTFFVTASILALLTSQETKKNKKYYVLSGLMAGLAILSKGQQAAIQAFPVLFLILARKISLSAFVFWYMGLSAIVLPWFTMASIKFGFYEVFSIFVLGFVKSRATVVDATQKAPIFWYLRYWFDSFRPGIFVFVAVLMQDIASKTLNIRKLTMLSFIFGTIFLYSVMSNKVWWYVMPAIPIMILYIAELLDENIRRWKGVNWALLLTISLASLPFLMYKSNTIVLVYGFGVILLGLLFIRFLNSNKYPSFLQYAIPITIFVTLGFFYIRFPLIAPTYPEAKEMGEYYQKIPGNNKCLFIAGMPYESVLFYSKANGIEYFLDGKSDVESCYEYLISEKSINKDLPPIFTSGRLKLFRLSP